MTRAPNPTAPAEPRRIRCAIYTRKSTSEGLESDFNTLDAQREAAEFYIRAMRHEGWEALPERYDDGGFTGGTSNDRRCSGCSRTSRPARSTWSSSTRSTD